MLVEPHVPTALALGLAQNDVTQEMAAHRKSPLRKCLSSSTDPAARGVLGAAAAFLPLPAPHARCWGGCGQLGVEGPALSTDGGTAPQHQAAVPASHAFQLSLFPLPSLPAPPFLCVGTHVSFPHENALAHSECQNPHGLQWNQGGYSCHGNLEVFPVPPRELMGSWQGAGAARQVLGGDGLASPSTVLSSCPFLCAWHTHANTATHES